MGSELYELFSSTDPGSPIYGTLDNSFGKEGIAVINLESGISIYEINSMQLQADGKITLGGQVEGDMAVLRFLENGELDASFAIEGRWKPRFNGCDYAKVKAHSIQDNGDIYIVGTQKCGLNNTDPYGVIYRINSSGIQDKNFGSGGLSTSSVWRSFFDLQIQPDGKILVVGSAALVSGTKITVARYKQNGVIDYFNFAYEGVFDDHNSDRKQTGVALLLRSDDEIIIGSESWSSRFRDFDFGITALTSAGIIDTSFGTEGRVHLDFGSNENGTLINW